MAYFITPSTYGSTSSTIINLENVESVSAYPGVVNFKMISGDTVGWRFHDVEIQEDFLKELP